MKRVLVLKGTSENNVLRMASDEVSAGFEKRGYQVTTVDLADKEKAVLFLKTTDWNYSFVFSIQGFFLSIGDFSADLFTRYLDIPFIGWFFDDFLYHDKRLFRIQNQDNNIYFLSVDRAMESAAKLINPNVGKVYHFLHGGFEKQGSWSDTEKTIDILYPGALQQEPSMQEVVPEAGESPV